ncbi:Protein of unknown function [Pyronema omphalodes CBS 100304]|uniref:Uncharacterized protein n=1 Tax=Pyronema omphalodes (strain CBS 100304) TaxID=1076935 RepID=U4LG70_PYROM|nr:Protein of unknown function [Pyronema omphalodes CBS 100304]
MKRNTYQPKKSRCSRGHDMAPRKDRWRVWIRIIIRKRFHRMISRSLRIRQLVESWSTDMVIIERLSRAESIRLYQ